MIGAGLVIAAARVRLPLLPVSIDDYLGQYAGHADITPGILGAAVNFLHVANAGLLLAQADGVVLHRNTVTGCLIAGSGNGGVRIQNAVDRNGRPVGAGHSKHKDGRAGDWFDPLRELCAWSLMNKGRLLEIGILAMEDPRWTPSWCHWQDLAVPSGHFAFVPSADAPLAAALPEQLLA
jgi:hypothetical protein